MDGRPSLFILLYCKSDLSGFPQVIYLDSYFCFVFALFFILLEYTLMSAEDVIYYELTQEDKVEE